MAKTSCQQYAFNYRMMRECERLLLLLLSIRRIDGAALLGQYHDLALSIFPGRSPSPNIV